MKYETGGTSATLAHENRLTHSKSPYLLQHAHNPVDWFPWGDEAFEKARCEDKPIFLSIGYSTCHWCHVMAHESFEDDEVARALNDVFVSIKVDREERPDIDAIYMTVCQAMTGSGGWPLTIVMTPDKKPFFAATYLPKESRFGGIGLLELAPGVQDAWQTRRAEVLAGAENIAEVLRRASAATPPGTLDESILKRAYDQLAKSFDSVHGGFGAAPKFPRPHSLTFLLRYWKRTGDANALKMVETTLRAMRRGGVFDQVGFGLHRYSTDARWLVPHFEKMLYDQAMAVIACTETFQATGNPEYQRTAREIIDYVLRDMTSPEGAFYSAEDADSEGEEGKFYLWTSREIRDILGDEDADRFMTLFGVLPGGNWSDTPGSKATGANILHLTASFDELARRTGMSEDELRKSVESARLKLFEARSRRVRPHKDDKVLTDWNGLMIAALAKAGATFDEPKFVDAAKRAVQFILKTLRTPDGRLLHRYRDGDSAVNGFLDDYAFFVWGLLELYEADFDTTNLQCANTIIEIMLTDFENERSGGFYQSDREFEGMLIRRMDAFDSAVPSGNSVAALNLARLGGLTGNVVLEGKGGRTLKAFAGAAHQAPGECTQLLQALDYVLGPTSEIVIAGSLSDSDTHAMLRALQSRFLPSQVTLLHDESLQALTSIAPFTSGQVRIGGKATAYVCHNHACLYLASTPASLLAALGIKS